MSAEIVMAVYRPKPGKADEMAALIERHTPLLRAEGPATERAPVVVRSQDGTFLEIFEWDTSESPAAPHQMPAVKEIWDEMETTSPIS